MSESGPQSQIEHLAKQYTGGGYDLSSEPEPEPQKSGGAWIWLLVLVLIGGGVLAVKLFAPQIWGALLENGNNLLNEMR